MASPDDRQAVDAVRQGFGYWLVRRKRRRKATLIDPDLFRSKVFRFGITEQMLQQIALGGTMFGVALLAGKKAGQRRPAGIILWGFVLLTAGLVVLIPVVPRADSGWYLLVPLVIAGSRWLLVG